MKTMIMFLAAVLSLASSSRAGMPTIEFDGETYRLAFVEVSKNGAVTNEYVKDGETIDAWTTLVAVRHWPKAVKIFDAAETWIKMVHPLLVKDMVPYKSDSAKSADDILFEAWLSASDRSYIEPNLFRFVIEEGTAGVKAYQFAEKIRMTGGKGDPTSFITRRNSRFKAVWKMEVAMHLAMPVATQVPAMPPELESKPAVAPKVADLTPVEAIKAAAEKADGIEGVFAFEVRSTGTMGSWLLLNSEKDYRSPQCLTVVVTYEPLAHLRARLGDGLEGAFVGKKIRVAGVAAQEKIRLVNYGAMAREAYFQTRVRVTALEQILTKEP